MKKGYKAILIAAAILLGTGAIATGAGLLMGARVQDMTVDGRSMQGWYEDRLTTSDAPHAGTTSTKNGKWSTLVNETYTDVTSLELSAGMGEVTIREGDGFAIVTNGRDDDVKVNSYVENGEWKIKTANKHKILGNNTSSTFEMTITVPKGWNANDIDLEMGMGTLEADVLRAREMSLDVGMGEIYVDELFSEETSLTCAMGQINIDTATLGKKTQIDCGMGQVNMTVEGKQADYGYRYSVGMGAVSVGDDSSAGLGSERSSNVNAAKVIEAECGMGQVTVEFTE